MWFCYISWSFLTPAGSLYATLNFLVHSLMYTWYALAAAKLKPAGFAIMITVFQIWQMFIGSFATGYMVYKSFIGQCQSNHWMVQWAGVLMYGSYLYLFIRFFIKKYCISCH